MYEYAGIMTYHSAHSKTPGRGYVQCSVDRETKPSNNVLLQCGLSGMK